MRGAAREVLEQLEREDRLGVVLLGRPYHNDPGVNHEILEEFQKLGYPVFAQDSLPIDDDIIWRLFGEDVEAGEIPAPHVDRRRVEELLQRKHQPQGMGRQVCGAPSQSGGAGAFELQVRPRRARSTRWWKRSWSTPARRTSASRISTRTSPPGSIKIRVETIGYFLKRYREDMVRNKNKAKTIEESVEGIRGPAAPPDAAREAGSADGSCANRSRPAPCRRFT